MKKGGRSRPLAWVSPRSQERSEGERCESSDGRTPKNPSEKAGHNASGLNLTFESRDGFPSDCGVRVCGMRTGICLSVTSADLDRLRAVINDRNAPQKHVWRAQIVLLSAEGLGTNAIMRETGKSKTCVWRWQARFATEGVAGLLRDKTRPSRIPKLDSAIAARVVALTMEEPPREATHWTGGAMAEAAGVSISSVPRIWRAHGLQPHRVRQFKLSNDPDFVGKLRDIVGLYVDPPAHAVVLSLDEKSQIQALDRTQPGLPLKKGRARTMTHDYKRNGTTTLFAAMNVLDGTVIGRNMQRHRHQEFIRFLNAVEREVRAGRTIHAIIDNYAAHKHPTVRRWLARHPRWTFHFTPTSASWLNAVEGFFAILTKRSLKRGVFRSVADLQAAINRFLDDHNAHSKPFQWVADPNKIIAALRRGHQALDSVH
jgi:transposase